jgi:hypothetical protein
VGVNVGVAVAIIGHSPSIVAAITLSGGISGWPLRKLGGTGSNPSK